MRIIRLPDTRERFNSVGLDAVGSTPEELTALIRKETVLYAELVKKIGLKPQ
jgi:tripartite-type tricarboxylate transporter receptor subunit TctC